MASPKFSLGQIVATPGALRAFAESREEPFSFLYRHASGDWGELDAEDQKENELSLSEGFRLLSAYRLKTGERLWIITEADRSVTTLLLPEEYLAGFRPFREPASTFDLPSPGPLRGLVDR
jgi:hypothetical protein